MDSWNPPLGMVIFESKGNGYFVYSTTLPFAKMGEPIQFIKNEKGDPILIGSNGVEIPKFEF